MTRKEVWEQASKQHGIASVMDRECDSYIYKGIKIMKCDGLYRIFNTKMKGDFYQEITEDQYEMFESSCSFQWYCIRNRLCETRSINSTPFHMFHQW